MLNTAANVQSAIETLVRYATDNIAARDLRSQAAIYDAISQVMPEARQREEAARIAFALREMDQLQRDFLPHLFTPDAQLK